MAACYYKPGVKASKSVPCNHTALFEGKHTQCCEPGDLCLTNGLCREETVDASTNYAWRFGCTDATFKDPSCGNYCNNITGLDLQLTWQCLEPDTWCCNTGVVLSYEERVNRTNTTCCGIQNLVFKAPGPDVYTTARPFASSFSIGTLMSSSSIAGSNPASTLSLPTITFTSNSLVVSTASASATAAPASGPAPLAIGLGAGLGSFAAIALGIGSFFLWRRRKRASRSSESVLPSKELPGNGLVEARSRNLAEAANGEHSRELRVVTAPAELAHTERAELSADEKGGDGFRFAEMYGSEKS